ncbi:M14 family zinc carboxypeptidase [Gudongella sp. DL1XJH-153]|uniref:M14 family zinc carboxypeptidase n=1 Tax=Gudongella sp. DL1XJH-153 TaxID=3409804 RepID=UPI003BB77BCB
MIRKFIVYPVLFVMALSPAISGSSIESDPLGETSDPMVQFENANQPLSIDDYLENPLLKLDVGRSYSSSDYSTIAKELSNRYPDIISYKTIGYSHDKKEIFSLVMTKNAPEMINRADFNVSRMHYYIEAGVHGRETVNPAILMKQIEDYATDYYKDSHIPGFNLEEILSKSVFHFVPLVNPDGHDLSKFGPDSVITPSAREMLFSINDKDYSQWKANIAGVDLNKNFPDFHLNRQAGLLEDKWQNYPGSFFSSVPSGEFYPGSYAGSEPETKAIMDYMASYDFRSYVSYHSRGNLLYYEYIWFPDEYRKNALEMAKKTNEITGYKLIPDTGEGSGYSTSYYVSISLKPSLTIETLPYNTALPSGNKTYMEAYEKTWLLPLYYEALGRKTGYFPYRLYTDGQYVRDFPDKEYAEAIAESVGGEIIEGSGVPEFIIE